MENHSDSSVSPSCTSVMGCIGKQPGGELARLVSKELINNVEIRSLMAASLCAAWLLPEKAHELLGLAGGVRRAGCPVC